MGWIASVLDFGAQLFAWDWSNNHVPLATHLPTQILQGFGLLVQLPYVGLRNYFIHKGR